MAYQKYIKDHLIISKYPDDIKISQLIWYFDILQSIVALILILKYHDVEYGRYIKGHLIISKYHDNIKISQFIRYSAIPHLSDFKQLILLDPCAHQLRFITAICCIESLYYGKFESPAQSPESS